MASRRLLAAALGEAMVLGCGAAGVLALNRGVYAIASC